MGRPCLLSLEQDAEIAKLYSGSEGLESLAVRYGVSVRTISNSLVRTKTPKRKPGAQSLLTSRRLLTEDQEKDVAARYEAGNSLRVISDAFGIGETVVSGALKRQGVTCRPSGRPKKAITPEELNARLEHRRARSRKYIKENRVRVTETSKKLRQQNQAWFRLYKATLSCSRCGFSHPAVLDFHHRNPEDKHAEVAVLASRNYSREKLLKEIAKCDVLCANCHRILHYEE